MLCICICDSQPWIFEIVRFCSNFNHNNGRKENHTRTHTRSAWKNGLHIVCRWHFNKSLDFHSFFGLWNWRFGASTKHGQTKIATTKTTTTHNAHKMKKRARKWIRIIVAAAATFFVCLLVPKCPIGTPKH